MRRALGRTDILLAPLCLKFRLFGAMCRWGAAPIASVTSVGQLENLARGARLTLSPNHLAILTEAGR